MYMCIPEAPSVLCGGRFSRPGIWPPMPAPTVSMRYLPTRPLLLETPLGACSLLELSRMRAVSAALAASTTTRAFTCRSVRVRLSM
jgi:hypothetical protein